MKLFELLQVSNPDRVYKNFRKLGLHNFTTLELSNRKFKKYKVKNPITNKYVHFGSSMADYTYTLDENKRNNFLKRNIKWKDAEIFTPAFLSYHLTWN